MRRSSVHAVALAVLFVLSSSPAQALSFLWSYEAEDGGIYAGSLEGTLIDADNVEVAALIATQFAGASPPTLSIFQGLSGPSPVVSFSGSFMDLAACFDIGCGSEFLVIGDLSPFFGVNPGFRAADAVGLLVPLTEPFIAARWTLTQIPEPAPGLLVGLGLAWLASSRNRRGRSTPSSVGSPLGRKRG